MKRTPSIATQSKLTTELSRVEEAVKTNEALLRLFIKHTPAAIAMFDTEMRYLQVSDRFLTPLKKWVKEPASDCLRFTES